MQRPLSPEFAEQRAKRARLAAILGLGCTQIIGWGTSFSAIPIFGTTVGQDLALPREWVFGGITVMLLVAAPLSPPIGRLVDRLGAQRVMITGSLVAALAMIAHSLASGLVTYLLGWVLIGIATPMMLSNASVPGLVQVVGPNARRAITGLTLISGLTSTVFFPLNQWLLTTIGWSRAYLVFAVLHLLVCAPIHWLVVRKGAGIAPDRPGTDAKRPPPDGVLAEADRRRAFVLLSIWICTEGLITWGLYLQIIDVLVGNGLTRGEAIALWAMVGPCQALARLGELLTGGRYSILTTAIFSALLVSASFLAVLPFGVSIPTAAAFCVAMGLGHGFFAIARNTLPLTLFGSREFGQYMGLLMVPQSIVNAAAPVVFAAVLARTDPGQALWIAAFAAWTGLVAVFCLVAFCRRHTNVG